MARSEVPDPAGRKRANQRLALVKLRRLTRPRATSEAPFATSVGETGEKDHGGPSARCLVGLTASLRASMNGSAAVALDAIL
jgi:hypothetical protein